MSILGGNASVGLEEEQGKKISQDPFKTGGRRTIQMRRTCSSLYSLRYEFPDLFFRSAHHLSAYLRTLDASERFSPTLTLTHIHPIISFPCRLYQPSVRQFLLPQRFSLFSAYSQPRADVCLLGMLVVLYPSSLPCLTVLYAEAPGENRGKGRLQCGARF